jgi:hypothetical protein
MGIRPVPPAANTRSPKVARRRDPPKVARRGGSSPEASPPGDGSPRRSQQDGHVCQMYRASDVRDLIERAAATTLALSAITGPHWTTPNQWRAWRIHQVGGSGSSTKKLSPAPSPVRWMGEPTPSCLPLTTSRSQRTLQMTTCAGGRPAPARHRRLASPSPQVRHARPDNAVTRRTTPAPVQRSRGRTGRRRAGRRATGRSPRLQTD